MPRAPSVILSAGERRAKVAALKREAKVASKSLLEKNRSINAVNKETATKLKALEKERAAAQKTLDKITDTINALLDEASKTVSSNGHSNPTAPSTEQ